MFVSRLNAVFKSRLNAVFKSRPNAVFMSRLNAVFMSPQRELGGASVARAPPNSRWGLLDIYVGALECMRSRFLNICAEAHECRLGRVSDLRGDCAPFLFALQKVKET